jgi:3-hydroxyacyl-[acyl-carrier-protein] dehydratase
MSSKEYLLNQEQIKEIIPHREPFILVDAVEELSETGIKAWKFVTGEEDFFRGHFPQKPVMPGVLIIEALAQAGAICVLQRDEFKGKIAYFAGIDKARFKRVVVPGDKLRLEAELTKLRGSIGFATAKAYVDDKLAASAEIMFAVEK